MIFIITGKITIYRLIPTVKHIEELTVNGLPLHLRHQQTQRLQFLRDMPRNHVIPTAFLVYISKSDGWDALTNSRNSLMKKF
jgi:hypothetical protein